jgi:site-specific recombinase XerD
MTGQLVALHPSKTISDAAEAFLRRDMAATTRRSYTQTINRLTAEHGAVPVGTLDGAILDAFTAAAWGQCAPATWNRHVATLRSFHRIRATPGLAEHRSRRRPRTPHRAG